MGNVPDGLGRDAASAANVKRGWAKPAAFVCLALAVVAASCAIGGADGFASFAPWAELEALVGENLALALAVYFACTVVGCTVFVLPGMVFALAAGMLFGPVLGTAACVVAATAGAVLAFLAGRFFLRDVIRPRAMRNAYLRRWLFEDVDVNAVALLAVTRLVPLFPYNLQNFAYGVTDMRLSTFAACSFLFMIPGTAMYVLAGAGIVEGAGGVSYFISAAVAAACVCAVSMLLKKRYRIDGEGVCDEMKGGE